MLNIRTLVSVILAGGLALVTLSPIAAAKPPAKILHKFCSEANCSDGALSYAGLIMDGSGNLYGTTARGGHCTDGCGTVFKVAPDGTETVLYAFCSQTKCTDGSEPFAGLTMDRSGNLYGTTAGGGTSTVDCDDYYGNFGCGTVFKLAPDGTETVLYSFCSAYRCPDGYLPEGGLVLDAAGNLYGTTYGGGAHSGGTVFKIASGGTETVLYSFCAQQYCTDGRTPNAGLVMDSSGNLYGMSPGGGANYDGAVFKVAPDGTEKVLYSFGKNAADGEIPYAGLTIDSAGNLYGTTSLGGVSGFGTVFKITPNGTETLLHSFAGGSDGYTPMAGLFEDSSGNLFGTTYYGGLVRCPRRPGCGTVFEIAPDGTMTSLYAFRGRLHGMFPQSGVIADSEGNLYGTTSEGGLQPTAGTVYRVNATITAKVMH